MERLHAASRALLPIATRLGRQCAPTAALGSRHAAAARAFGQPSSSHASTAALQQRRQSSLQASTSGRDGPAEYILGIESSCDDTGVAVLRASDGAVLGHCIATQVDIHAQWGGVVPNLAMQAHRDAMDGTVAEALAQAGLAPGQLDAVAVTIGPGLSLCLKVGVLKAIRLAHAHGLRYVPVHHMEAHALVPRLAAPVAFPFLCLLVSGGHNMLLVAEGVGRYTLLGATLDDAVGEAFDKAARLLGLKLRPSGGAALEALAAEGDPARFRFSQPLRKYADCNFSYAGMKTAVRLAAEEQLPEGPAPANRQVRADIAASFQRVAVAHLAERVARGAAWTAADFPEARQLVVAGGVAANRLLRARLGEVAQAAGLQLVCPPPQLCTDNGVMVAWAGLERSAPASAAAACAPAAEPKQLTGCSAAARLRAGFRDELPPLPVEGEEFLVDVRPRWPLTDRLDPRSPVQKRSQRSSRIFPSLTELTRRGAAEVAAV